MVKNGPNSLRNSTSNLSLRPQPPSSNADLSAAAARQQIADLEARIAQLQACDNLVPAPPSPESVRESTVHVNYPSEEEDETRAMKMKYNGADGINYVREALSTTSTRMPFRQYPALPPTSANWPRQYFAQSIPPHDSHPYGGMPDPFGRLYPGTEPASHASERRPEKSLFEKYNESLQEQRNKPKGSLITTGLMREGNVLKSPEAYTQPFCDFLTDNPTVWHTVSYFETKLGGGYKAGNGVVMIAGHVDALTARLKPISNKRNAAGYVQLGVAPYAGALNPTWWDRDLGVGGRVLVKDSTGKITTKLVKLGWPSKLHASFFEHLLT
jgi:hypothetical protein